MVGVTATPAQPAIKETLQTATPCQKFTFQHVIDHFYETGLKQGSLKELKQGIGWSWMVRYLRPDQKQALSDAYAQGLADGGNDVKNKRLRERRLQKLNALWQDGQSSGRIRSAMNVQKWSDQEKAWFVEQVARLRDSTSHGMDSDIVESS